MCRFNDFLCAHGACECSPQFTWPEDDDDESVEVGGLMLPTLMTLMNVWVPAESRCTECELSYFYGVDHLTGGRCSKTVCHVCTLFP